MVKRLGIIGCGQWGQNYLRNFSDMPERAAIVACADSDPARLEALRLRYRDSRMTLDAVGVLEAPDVEAVVIATTSATHADLVERALDAGKHVLVEKPFVLDMDEGERLVRKARAAGLVILVGHIYEYNPSILRMRDYLADHSLGEPYYIQSTRTNLGPIRGDVNVLWDLGPHDVSILMFLLGMSPTTVTATGRCCFDNGRHDIVFGTLQFPRGVLGQIHVSWLNPRKVREITVVGASRMLVFNDLDPLEPVRVYDRGLSEVPSYRTFGEFQLVPRFGEITIPRIPSVEPLRAECEHFLDCLDGKARPRSSGEDGVRVVRVLSALQRSLEQNGAPVPVDCGPPACR